MSNQTELPSREEIEERAKQKKVHLKKDLGLDKGTLKRKARRDGIYGAKLYDDICDLLDEHRQTYTIEEARMIVNNVVSTSHDMCVAENPEDFHRFAVTAAEENIEKRDRIDDKLIEMRKREESRIVHSLQNDVWEVLRDDEQVAADLETDDRNEARTEPIPEDLDYHDRAERHNGEPCVVCGRDASESPYYVLVAGGGGLAVHIEDFRSMDDDTGGLGWGGWLGRKTIGSTCKDRLDEAFVGDDREEA